MGRVSLERGGKGMITYQLGKRIVEGSLIKENQLTVWTQSPDGKRIKRHKIRHKVIEIEKRPKYKRGDRK